MQCTAIIIVPFLRPSLTMTQNSTASGCSCGGPSARLETTVAAVDWNVLASIACSLHGVTSSRWGDQFSGGFNVVRFLHLDDANGTVIVIRIPYQPAEGWTEEHSKTLVLEMSSEVAVMRYLTTHSSIPVPRIIHHCVEADGGGVGSPYMIMTKIDGVPLSSVWDDMADDKREIVLRMVVDILLELASHRFDKIGTLFQREHSDNATKPSWYVAPMIADIDNIPSVTFTSATDYWFARANAKLECIRNTDFGHHGKMYDYGFKWFMRSLIPSLYDSSSMSLAFRFARETFTPKTS